MNWQELAATSHYQTAVAVADELRAGRVEEATEGLEELIDAVGRSERRALRSQLIRLMLHILKWKVQPARRSGSWATSIQQARLEIEAIQEEVPSLTRQEIEATMWDYCSAAAKRGAEEETGLKVDVDQLTVQEVFEVNFSILEEKSEQPSKTRKGKRKRG